MTSLSTIGERVQRLRLAAGLNQAELATKTKVPTGVVSMIENGRQAVDDVMLASMADALRCDPAYLVRPVHDLVSTRPWLRAYADASKRAVDRYVADTLIAVEAIESLGLKTLPDTIPTFTGDLNDDDAIEAYALDVREAAQLGDFDVVGNSMRAAERLGCILLPMDDELGRHLGLSMRVNGTAVIRISRPVVDDDGNLQPPGDRQRFTVAHELGHIGLHSTCPPPATAEEAARIEKQAHRFAAAFLAPAEPLLDDLRTAGGRVTLTTLAHLKGRWGVAIKALVLRMQQLDQIEPDHARSLYKQISARKWNKLEPVPVGNEDAIWYRTALEKAYARNKTQATPASEMAATHSALSTEFFTAWTDWTPRETPTADVVQLVVRGHAADARFTGDNDDLAPVTRLNRS